MAGNERIDVVIAGGGVAGLGLALALRTALGGSLSVTLCDPALASAGRRDGRAFAFAAGPRRMLEALGAWTDVAPGAQPILDMIVTDSRVADPVRPVFLTFAGEVEPGKPFAHMVEHADLLSALEARCRATGVVLRTEAVASAVPQGGFTRITLAGGAQIDTSLAVACDGARSPLREAAGIGTVSWAYGQSGIVATIGHERPHEGRAEEHFLPSGPFAILPMTGLRSSIVWTERSDAVEALLGLDDEDILDEIERRFGLHRGRLSLLGRPRAYPLSFAIARRFAGDRLALVGDAAHVIHPIAGQGLNMGLRDAAALAEAICDAAALGLDPGGPAVLEAYTQARRFDTVMMGAVTDGLNRLFATDSTPVRMLRDLGLGVVDRLPGLKSRLIREAAALSGGMPRLLRGEIL